MRQTSKDLAPRSMPRDIAQDVTAAPGESDRGAGDAKSATTTVTDREYPIGDEEITRRPQHNRWRPPRGSPAERRTRRLGLLEYTLLTVIGLSVAITIAMAILDPSG